jgi:hypothetical protein
MLWISKHKKVWRVAILVIGVVALLGPWFFDFIWVPTEYTCSAPYVRLDSDYCGRSQPGYFLFKLMIGGFSDASKMLVAGTLTFIEWVRESLRSLFLLLLIMPLFSTLFLILRCDGLRQRVFSTTAWGLVAGIGLLIGLSSYPQRFWLLWGLWLYITMAASALVLEILVLRAVFHE